MTGVRERNLSAPQQKHANQQIYGVTLADEDEPPRATLERR